MNCPECNGNLLSRGHIDTRGPSGEHVARQLFECESCGRRFFAGTRASSGFEVRDIKPALPEEWWPGRSD